MSIQILLVDDNPGDLRLIGEAFLDSKRAITIHSAADGIDAMRFLNRERVHVHAPRPDLILLDLNLPKMDGRQVLTRIKTDADLKAIPIIILTSSEAEADIVTAYQLQGNCYLTKPLQLDAFQNVIKSIGDFWLTKVILPRHPAGHAGEETSPRQGAGRLK
jgi:CheY-like chemotaxis protein